MKWTPVDIIILIITIAVTAAFVFIHVGTLIKHEPMAEKSAQILGQIYFAFIAIVSIYVGAKIRNNGKN